MGAMDVSQLPMWLSLIVAIIIALLGGATYVHAQDDRSKRAATDQINAAKKELIELRKEDQERFVREVSRLEKLSEEEKAERQREADRMEKTLEGFADVSSAVVSMGKSLEYLSERLADHRKSTEDAMLEIKSTLKSVETQVISMTATSKARRSQA
jgi:formiminotetrahydrofolate cyclodeaminase